MAGASCSPKALAGVLPVAVLYHLVRRTFGTTAGLVVALVLALTPISVATNRNDTIDCLLVLTVLLAAWGVVKAAETGHLRWLILGMTLVGLGFNIKMLQAYLVLPALVLVYLLGARLGCAPGEPRRLPRGGTGKLRPQRGLHWGDRHDAARPRETLLRRWVAFHGAIIGTALLNQAVFAAARATMPTLAAAALGIGTAAVVDFVALDRVTFRSWVVGTEGGRP